MCTVTYLPKGKNAFIMTHNRDEKRSRPVASPPKVEKLNDLLVMMPRDSKAKGTWFAASQDKRVVCLLNGAFRKHISDPPYRHSRGDIIPAYLSFENIQTFLDYYWLDEIEPFTLILFEYSKLYELRWDGKKHHLKKLDAATTHIFSSVTLYTKEAIEDRKKWFSNWLTNHKDFEPGRIREFHCHGGKEDRENALVMKRSDIYHTVSITSVEQTKSGSEMFYKDMLDKSESTTKITF